MNSQHSSVDPPLRPAASASSPARGRWLVWCLWGLVGLVVALSLILVRVNHMAGVPSTYQATASVALFALEFATVGGLIVSRRPDNHIGWLFCAIGVAWALQSIAPVYARAVSFGWLASPRQSLWLSV
jgi:hypothetical protein